MVVVYAKIAKPFCQRFACEPLAVLIYQTRMIQRTYLQNQTGDTPSVSY